MDGKVDDENGNEFKGVQIESRSKLDYDEKVKFVRFRKSVRLRKKVCGLKIYGSYFN